MGEIAKSTNLLASAFNLYRKAEAGGDQVFELFTTQKTRNGMIPPTLRIVESSAFDSASDDLPCPWCHAPTAETDEHCPACRRTFGELRLSL